jgi:hypothetical protein
LITRSKFWSFEMSFGMIWILIVDDRLLKYAMEVGFYKEREVSFPHKQANLLKIRRDAWEQPAL